MRGFGLDIGGSGIKGAPVDLESGELAGERARIETPQPATPEAIVGTAVEVVRQSGWEGPVGCGFPAVIQGGVARTAANIEESAVGFDFQSRLEEGLEAPVRLVNDADAAGLAEARWGAGRGVEGTVLVLTLGSGIGSALFTNGRLVPNTEMGHVEIDGRVAEHLASDGARKREGLGWDEYAQRLNRYLSIVERVLWPELIIFGGGVSKKSGKFLPLLSARAEMVPAELLNTAGIAGAALAVSPEAASVSG